MRSILPILASVALSACATTSGPPKVEIQRVEIPVVVPCVKAADIPEEPKWATENLPPVFTIFDLTKALAAESIQRKAYVPSLLALLEGCK